MSEDHALPDLVSFSLFPEKDYAECYCELSGEVVVVSRETCCEVCREFEDANEYSPTS